MLVQLNVTIPSESDDLMIQFSVLAVASLALRSSLVKLFTKKRKKQTKILHLHGQPLPLPRLTVQIPVLLLPLQHPLP